MSAAPPSSPWETIEDAAGVVGDTVGDGVVGGVADLINAGRELILGPDVVIVPGTPDSDPTGGRKIEGGVQCRADRQVADRARRFDLDDPATQDASRDLIGAGAWGSGPVLGYWAPEDASLPSPLGSATIVKTGFSPHKYYMPDTNTFLGSDDDDGEPINLLKEQGEMWSSGLAAAALLGCARRM